MVGLVSQDSPSVPAQPFVVVTQYFFSAGPGGIADLAGTHEGRWPALRFGIVGEPHQGGALSAEASAP